MSAGEARASQITPPALLRLGPEQLVDAPRDDRSEVGLLERFLDHGLEKTATYLESPVREMTRSHRRLDWRLDRDGMLPFPLLEELREEGFVHYVIAPVPFAAGPINALAWATRHKQGFPPEALGQQSLPRGAAREVLRARDGALHLGGLPHGLTPGAWSRPP